MIVVRDVEMSPDQLMQFSNIFSPEFMNLPPKFYFGNLQPGYPFIWRVGNLKPDGTITGNHIFY